jgi:hypothetical protein
MPSSYALNLKEGSRSEILADYLFSQWGAVTPVRRQDDFGIDLYCTLFDRIGQSAVVRDYFSVQVKSTLDPWIFDGNQAVRWLVEYPSPLFLACVDKKKGSVAVYQTMARFARWALGALPDRLELTLSDKEHAESVGWIDGTQFTLEAPIIKVTLADLIDEEKMSTLRHTFEFWVSADRENCDLLRRGLYRFRMPLPYRINQLPNESIMEAGNAAPQGDFLNRGILTLAEDAECLGGQLYRLGDRPGALRALLLVSHLRQRYADTFQNQLRWNQATLPGELGAVVSKALNDAVPDEQGPPNGFEGIRKIDEAIETNPIVRRFLEEP